MSRIRKLSALGLVVLAGVLLSAAAGSGSTPFAITHLDVPLLVKQNGPKGTRSIAWQGNPTFPVVVHEHGLCPETVNCGTRDAKGFGPVATVTFSTRSNPLVSKGFYYCNGSFTADYIIGVEDWLTDAKGHRTAPVRNFWVCKTH